MLGWFLAFVQAVRYPPFVFYKPVHYLLIVGFGLFDVGLAVAAVFVRKENYFLAGMVLVVLTELVHQFIEHGVRYFIRLYKKLIDDAIHRFGVFCGEVVKAFLTYGKQTDLCAPIRADFERFSRVAIQIEAAIDSGKLFVVEIIFFRIRVDKGVVGGVVIDVAGAVQVVIAIFHFIYYPVHYFDKENKLRQFLILPGYV